MNTHTNLVSNKNMGHIYLPTMPKISTSLHDVIGSNITTLIVSNDRKIVFNHIITINLTSKQIQWTSVL
jgi:hypothetical protein